MDAMIIYQKLFPSVTPKGDLKKLEIIEAATRLVASAGYDALSFEAIATAIGTTKSHVNYHFKSKEAIVLAAVRYVTVQAQDITVAALEQASGWRQQVRAINDGAFQWAEQHPEQLAVIAFFYFHSNVADEWRALYREIRRSGARRLAEILSEPLPDTSQAGREAVANSIQNVIFGHLFDALAAGNLHRLGDYRSRSAKTSMALIAASIAG